MHGFLRWCLAYFGAIYFTGLAIFGAFYVMDGFVGDIWAVFAGPLFIGLLVGAVLLLPAVFIDRMVVRLGWDVIPVYAVAGVLATTMCLFAWMAFDQRDLPVKDPGREVFGVLLIGLLGGLGGALFRMFKGAEA